MGGEDSHGHCSTIHKQRNEKQLVSVNWYMDEEIGYTYVDSDMRSKMQHMRAIPSRKELTPHF